MPSAATSTTASSPSNPFRRRFSSCVSALTADWVYMEGGEQTSRWGPFSVKWSPKRPYYAGRRDHSRDRVRSGTVRDLARYGSSGPCWFGAP